MDMNRRALLSAFAALPLAACAHMPAIPGEGARPYKKIGLQLYTVRDAFTADPEGTLGRVRALGYDEVEFINFGGKTPADFKQMVANAGLAGPSGHVSLADLRDHADSLFADMATAGASYAILAWLPENERKDWIRMATEMNGYGARARAHGLKFGYHNHNFEFIPTSDNQIPYELLVANTDPSVVCFEMDCYWVSFAGHDPMDILNRHGDRIRQLHLKDKTASGDMAPVGQGVIDFPAILKKAKSAGVEHVYVEHDNPADPFASIAASIKSLKG